jgi:hypothetical protein
VRRVIYKDGKLEAGGAGIQHQHGIRHRGYFSEGLACSG